MPILFADDFPPEFGGIQKYMRSLADALHVIGKSVIVIAPIGLNSQEYDQNLPYPVIRYEGGSRARRFVSNAVAGLRVGKNTSDYTIASLWFPSGLAVALLPKAIRGPLGVLAHGSDVSKPQGLRRQIMRMVFNRADAVIANSRFTRDLLLGAGVNRKIDISPCGVGCFESTGKPADQPLILAVGRLIKRKGFDRLINSMPAIIEAYPHATCEIVGNGPQLADLQRRVCELNLSNAVKFSGSVDDESLRNAYSRAWCFALPVRRNENDVEGFGIVYLEAAMAQLAAVGGIDSGAADAIVHGETGMLVDGNNTEQISAAIIALLRDRRAAEFMGVRARLRAVQHFSWARCAERIDNIMTRTA